MNAVAAPNLIPKGNLIYGWKIFGLAAVILGLVMFSFSLAGVLLDSSPLPNLRLEFPEVGVGSIRRSRG